ncbi:protein FAR-RED ELONGATED HYPOCOTYL 3-like [Salvia miltiorrhiza]|uniref:protein FAR-RED ELONGATED HYPOCOTYL 3-like n=1 Tax=Salvia miltiorrhiza TaxID=226208 RepID=UPI0025AC78D8|nr:protein FAR-RED ELONGATED HYPOCOTYL 3-like [Salvia miltiorrhiza]
MNIKEDTPKIGMSFATEEDAYGFYLKYSKRVGFGIRRSKSHKNTCGELVDRIYCCSAQGKRSHDKRDIYVKKARPETRFDCQAKLKVSSRETGKLCVVQFVEEHNHYLSSPNKIHLHRSHRKIAPVAALQIQMANDVGITPKTSHDLMARQADAKMRTNYSHFEDVVFFDTTYRKNNEGHPIALFVGVNHHKQTVIFGVALLYDETSVTFEWLFDTFTRVMCEKKPITILTDQDAAMAKALSSIWPETYHRLCLWHFAKDFGACVYDYEEDDEFFAAWDNMLKKYRLEDNDWLRRMFKLKEKWALVYRRQMFCADMTTTQRSESVNSIVKMYVNYKHKFLEFFNHFKRLFEDRRYEELKADFKANTSVPSMVYPVEILKHAASIYTPEVHKKFEQEWYKSHDSSLEYIEDDGMLTKYKITPHKEIYHHIVTFDSSSGKTNCGCRKFEFAGILCSHILKASEDEDTYTYKIIKDGILKVFDMVDGRLQGQELDQHAYPTSLLLNKVDLQSNERNTSGAKGNFCKFKSSKFLWIPIINEHD